MTGEADLSQFERDPDYWWLRMRYAIRDGRDREAEEARKRLSDLGVEVRVKRQEGKP